MREIRPYGSARGVRSNPYPYRDHPSSGAKHRLAHISPYSNANVSHACITSGDCHARRNRF